MLVLSCLDCISFRFFPYFRHCSGPLTSSVSVFPSSSPLLPLALCLYLSLVLLLFLLFPPKLPFLAFGVSHFSFTLAVFNAFSSHLLLFALSPDCVYSNYLRYADKEYALNIQLPFPSDSTFLCKEIASIKVQRRLNEFWLVYTERITSVDETHNSRLQTYRIKHKIRNTFFFIRHQLNSEWKIRANPIQQIVFNLFFSGESTLFLFVDSFAIQILWELHRHKHQRYLNE